MEKVFRYYSLNDNDSLNNLVEYVNSGNIQAIIDFLQTYNPVDKKDIVSTLFTLHLDGKINLEIIYNQLVNDMLTGNGDADDLYTLLSLFENDVCNLLLISLKGLYSERVSWLFEVFRGFLGKPPVPLLRVVGPTPLFYGIYLRNDIATLKNFVLENNDYLLFLALHHRPLLHELQSIIKTPLDINNNLKSKHFLLSKRKIDEFICVFLNEGFTLVENEDYKKVLKNHQQGLKPIKTALDDFFQTIPYYDCNLSNLITGYLPFCFTEMKTTNQQ